MKRASLVLVLALPVLAAAACGHKSGAGGRDSGAGGPDVAAPASDATTGSASDAAPITAPTNTWTWIDVPGSACDDGSRTGFAVNPGTGDDLLVYFEGGGACWDYATCFVVNSAIHGPVQAAQWATRAAGVNVGPFDRTRATNAFRASSYVYIPYCTGDMHAGNNVATYTALDTRTYHHVGRANAELYLPRIAATFAHPSRVVVGGTSAGGFGATFNYDLFRKAYPSAKMALVDDAGPLLEGEGIPGALRAAWVASWKLNQVTDPLCGGATCRDDLSKVYSALVARYPDDRMALLSAVTDPVIGVYFMLSADQFQADLRATVKDRFEPTKNARVYLIAGTQHGLLGMTTTITSGGMLLETWLGAMVGGGAWGSVAP